VEVLRGRSRRRTINLALQGGGAHGAFTWGVLDRLLEAPEIEIAWISGTSAGAVNAAGTASGLAAGGRSEARMTLRRLWQAVERAGVPDLVRLNPLLSSLTRAAQASNVGALLSPYEFNLLRLDPLRDLLKAEIDFAAIRAASPVELLIAATDVVTGRARLFRRAELDIEHVLASACLPTLHRAVEIQGRAYWDGGFSANPDLVTLATESSCRDTLIVELNPLTNPHLPRTASGIAGRVSEITFNQPYFRDLEMIVAARDTARGFFGARGGDRVARLARHRFHLIAAGRYTAELGSASKSRPDGWLLSHLFDSGRHEAEQWLATHAASVGRVETVDIAARLREPPVVSAALPPKAGESGRDAPGAAE